MTEGGAKPVRVAIFGGGAGALTTALALTDPARSEKYEVTVYTLGWRLGGKGASGRNPLYGNRIEEHGIHVWFGFYDNAFALLDGCYKTLAEETWMTPENRPVAISRCVGKAPNDGSAFYPHEHFVVNEQRPSDGSWSQWRLRMPTNSFVPGDGKAVPPETSLAFLKLAEMLESMAELRKEQATESLGAPPPAEPPPQATTEEEREFLTFVERRVERGSGSSTESAATLGPEQFLEQALDGLAAPALDQALAPPEESLLDEEGRFRLRLRFVAWTLRCAREALSVWAAVSERGRRIYLACDTFAAVVTGLSRDVFNGEDRARNMRKLDALELRDWLEKHGGDAKNLLSNPTVRFIYNSAFAFEDGDHERPRIAAGAALRGVLRLFQTYKGAFAYRMSAGMGDVVFSPIYELLKRRGVTFKFFHRLDTLSFAEVAGGPVVSRIEVTEQVRLAGASYDPFVWVNDFPCWPSEPRFEQLTHGDVLAAAAKEGTLNLEDPAAVTGEEAKHVLVRGADFDEVVLGIPVEAVKAVAGELRTHPTAGPSWRAMLDNASTTPTQAFQLWFRASLADLGWNDPAPVFGTYIEPIDTYIDMTPALALESRRADDVKNLSYFCGVMKRDVGATHDQAMRQARSNAIEHLVERCSYIWPTLGSGADFKWQLLWGAKSGRSADENFRAGQFSRANVLPSELYTLNLPGSGQYRLAPDVARQAKPGTAFTNLWLAGDWTANPISLGCVEATVMSGLMAARGLANERASLPIVGEDDDYMWQSIGRGTRPLSNESLAPSAPAAAKPLAWDGEAPARLKEAIDTFDRPTVEVLCEAFVHRLEREGFPEAADQGPKILSALRSQRHFDLMQMVAEALIEAEVAGPKIRRQYAQALIDQGHIPAALSVLSEVAAPTNKDDDERAEGLGLVGRAHKQLYVNAPSAPRAAGHLRRAIESYRLGREVSKKDKGWHAVNLVALLERAKQDWLPLGPELGSLDARALAREAREGADEKPRKESTIWDAAIAAEASLAFDDDEETLDRFEEYLGRAVKAGAFELASTLRQLQELWGLRTDEGLGKTIIPRLNDLLLKQRGGRIDLTAQGFHRARSNLQKTFGDQGAMSLAWYRNGLERCRLVARITDLNSVGGGSGFLVRARDVLTTDYPDELLLLTNEHVVSATPSSAGTLHPTQALVRFEAMLDPPANPPTHRIGTILRSSPANALDFTLARLEPAPLALPPYPHAELAPDAKGASRVYVIGHPKGGGLSVSLYDNLVLDGDGTFLHYRTPTEPGSSGSPVFNEQWQLVALHHAGDRKMRRLHGLDGVYEANEGINVAAIRQALSS